MSEVIRKKVYQILSDQLGYDEDQISLESDIVEDLDADSLDAVELIMAFEEEYNIEISDEDAEKLRSPMKIISYINEKCS